MRTFETLQEALYELSKLVGATDRIDGAPKESGDDGPVPISGDRGWREMKRDLSDVPRGERWLLRKHGEGRGKKAKGVKNYIAVCLCEESTALVGYSPSQVILSRALDAREWDTLRKYEDILKFKEEALNGIQVLQRQTMVLIGDSITHANNAGSSAGLISELSKAQAELLDDLSESRASNNTSKGIMHVLNRIVSYVQLRKIKNWDELRAHPEMRKDITDFFKWRDERDAPPPDDGSGPPLATDGE